MKKKGDKIDQVLEVVEFIKDRMVTKSELKEDLGNFATKEDLKETEERLTQAINSKNDGAHRRLDQEVDKRKLLEVRVSKLETRR
ncbi:hypothetical protein HY969_01385 [Candidatus Kaiserbacteria bacterium]|nr:hypothetical protein [Candidatus Kaiserbacteria bacterium]